MLRYNHQNETCSCAEGVTHKLKSISCMPLKGMSFNKMEFVERQSLTKNEVSSFCFHSSFFNNRQISIVSFYVTLPSIPYQTRVRERLLPPQVLMTKSVDEMRSRPMMEAVSIYAPHSSPYQALWV